MREEKNSSVKSHSVTQGPFGLAGWFWTCSTLFTHVMADVALTRSLGLTGGRLNPVGQVAALTLWD